MGSKHQLYDFAILGIFVFSISSAITQVKAAKYVLPPDDVDLVGALEYIDVTSGQFPIDIAMDNKIGQDEFLAANPELMRFIPVGHDQPSKALLPTRYILPSTDRRGVVINLAEKRLYYFPEVQSLPQPPTVLTFPVSIGKTDWQTPVTITAVTGRNENPPWYPPASIRLEAEQRGIALPDVVPPGPNNPLGLHAIYLDLPGYLIHGTTNPSDIGTRVTHGCIRMYPADIAFLFTMVPDGVKVHITHEPVKVGWYAGTLYIEVHEPLLEMNLSDEKLFGIAIELVNAALDERPVTTVQSKMIRQIVETKSGYPVALSIRHPDWPR